MCEAKTGGGEGAPTTCYTISIDYVMLRTKRQNGGVAPTQPWRTISPPGVGKLAVSHTAFSFDQLEGDGSVGAFEHYRPSKVSSRNEVKGTDRSLPYHH